MTLNQERLNLKWVVTAVFCVLCVAALTASLGAIHARLYGHDIFFLLDNGWRALHGQRVHVDYVSAWGPLTFLLVAAGLAASGGSVAAVTYANAMFAVGAGLWAIWLAAGRSRSFLVVIWASFVALMAAAPFALGDPPAMTSQAMIYNRYGDVLLFLAMLECFVPGRRKWLEPTLTGCVLGLLLFLKVSYFLIAVPMVALPLLFRQERGTARWHMRLASRSLHLVFWRTCGSMLPRCCQTCRWRRGREAELWVSGEARPCYWCRVEFARCC